MSSYAFSKNLKRLVLLCEYVVVQVSEGHINSIATKMHRRRYNRFNCYKTCDPGNITRQKPRKYILYIELKEYIFSSILARLNQLQCSATLIYGITVHDFGKMQNTSPAGLLGEESNIDVF